MEEQLLFCINCPPANVIFFLSEKMPDARSDDGLNDVNRIRSVLLRELARGKESVFPCPGVGGLATYERFGAGIFN